MFRRSSIVLCATLLFVASCNPLGGDTEVETTLLVVKKTPTDVLAADKAHSGYIEDSVATQMVLIRSPAIISRAMKMPNVAQMGLGSDVDAIFAVRNALTVRREGEKDNLITITWKGADANQGKVILDAVTVAYQAFLDETYKTVSDRTMELILEAKRTLSGNLQHAEQEFSDFRRKNPFLNTNPDQVKLKFATMSALEDKKAASLAARAELEGRLAWAEKAIADRDDKLAFQLKVNEWAARSGYDKLPKESRQGLEPQQAYISVLKQDLAENLAVQKRLSEAIETEQKRMMDMNNYEIQEERLRNAIASHRTLFDNIVRRLQEVNLVKDFGGYEARQVSPPRVKK